MRALFARLATMEAPPPWSLFEMTNALAFMLIGMILFGPTISTLIFGDVLTPTALFAGWLIGLLVAIFYVLWARSRQKHSLEAMRLGPGAWPRPMYILLGLSASVSVHLLVALGSGVFVPPPALQGMRTAAVGAWILAGVFMLVVQPIGDELIFRGVVLPWLRARLGAWGGLLFTIGIYALFHSLIYPTAIGGNAAFYYGQVYPLLMGAFFCGVRLMADSTQAAVLAHVGAGIFAFFSAPILLN